MVNSLIFITDRRLWKVVVSTCDVISKQKVLLLVEICSECLHDLWNDCTCVQPLAVCQVVYGENASNDLKSMKHSKQEGIAHGPVLRKLLTISPPRK